MELADELKTAWDKAAGQRRKAVAVHLFGIRHAKQIRKTSINRLVSEAGLPYGYANELRKMLNVEPHVLLRT